MNRREQIQRARRSLTAGLAIASLAATVAILTPIADSTPTFNRAAIVLRWAISSTGVW